MKELQYSIEDDTGVMATFLVSDYDSVEEAQLEAIEHLVDWFEDEDELGYDEDVSEEAVAQLHEYRDSIKCGEFETTQEISVFGFVIELK